VIWIYRTGDGTARSRARSGGHPGASEYEYWLTVDQQALRRAVNIGPDRSRRGGQRARRRDRSRRRIPRARPPRRHPRLRHLRWSESPDAAPHTAVSLIDNCVIAGQTAQRAVPDPASREKAYLPINRGEVSRRASADRPPASRARRPLRGRTPAREIRGRGRSGTVAQPSTAVTSQRCGDCRAQTGGPQMRKPPSARVAWRGRLAVQRRAN
jgi:hypothetical protein